IGLGLALGGIVYWGIEAFSIFDINGVSLGYVNPGFTITVIAFIGGLIGYFVKRRGVKYADGVGSAIGCVAGGIIVACVLFFVVFFLASRA
ncbi:MAG: hypothetical protein Q8L64_01280, partial [bacterium]|nr:hypothetical protein [bacterium]